MKTVPTIYYVFAKALCDTELNILLIINFHTNFVSYFHFADEKTEANITNDLCNLGQFNT